MYRRKVDENWFFWRPIVERMATYTEMCDMTPDEMMEFNAAIDSQIQRKKDAGGGK